MRYLTFPGASGAHETRISLLGFGCAPLLGRASRRESLAALGAAFDAGITFFDNARSYGYGASEGLLGEFLEGRRRQAIVCTKFGILPAATRNWKQRLKPAARALLNVFPGLRKTVRRYAADQFQPGHFSVATLQSSFETSLRELRTDYVDMLLLHDAPASVLAQDDLLEALQRLVAAGKVRMAGISGSWPVIERTLTERPPVIATAQFAMDLSRAAITAQNSDLLLVANHPFGGAAGAARTRRRIAQMAASPSVSPQLREKLAAPDPQLFPEIVLHSLLSATGISAVVAGMVQPAHIRSNVLALEHCRFTDEELAAVRFALSAPASLA